MPLSALALEILGYLECHPKACDTLVGIARWWLLRQRVATITRDVKRALDELVENGLAVQANLPDGQLVYRLNARRRKRTGA